MDIHRRLWNWCRRPKRPVSTKFARLATPLYVSVLIGALLLTAYAAVVLLPPMALKSSSDESGKVTEVIEKVEFPGGAIVVYKHPYMYGYPRDIIISIEVHPYITSGDDLLAYVNSRTKALNDLRDSISAVENIYVSVTFKEPLGRTDFVNLWRGYLEKPLEYAIIVENETSGDLGILVLGMPSHDEPDFMEYFTNPKGFKLISVIGFQAIVKADVAETFEQDSRILLVDPHECLTTSRLAEKYSSKGFYVAVTGVNISEMWKQYVKVKGWPLEWWM